MLSVLLVLWKFHKPNKRVLETSTDRKVTPVAIQRKNGRWDPRVKNTYGLPAKYCTDRTEFCDKHCYAEKIEKHRPNVRNLLERNWEFVSAHLDDYFALAEELDNIVGEASWGFRRHRVPKEHWVFRHFWDGDIPSESFALAMRDVAYKYPDIKFWVYTRSFGVVTALSGPTNLQVYLSVDNFNVSKAIECEKANPWVKLAFCADTWAQTLLLADKFPHRRRGPRCPELTGKVPLVNDGIGACVDCGLCIKGVNNVRFAASNK